MFNKVSCLLEVCVGVACSFVMLLYGQKWVVEKMLNYLLRGIKFWVSEFIHQEVHGTLVLSGFNSVTKRGVGEFRVEECQLVKSVIQDFVRPFSDSRI